MFLLVNGFGSNGPKIRRTRLDPPLNETAKVSDLRSRVSEAINKTPDSFILMHCGVVLEDDDQALTAVNIRAASSSVHVLPKPSASKIEPVPPKTMSEEEIQQFMIAFSMAFHNPAFNRVVQRLKHRESLENLVAACPDLAKDPVACAFLMKPELLISLLDADTLKYVLSHHPGLVEAANFLAAAVHEEKPAASSDAGAGNPDEAPAPFAYNLDEISDDDEEMEAAAPQDQRMPAARPIITPDQLAAALASAQQGSLFGGMTGLLGQNQPRGGRGSEQTMATSVPSTSSAASSRSSLPPPSPGGFITSDQLAAALAAASPLFAAAAQQQQVRNAPPSAAAAAPPLSGIETSLREMREMGIVDEGLARRALMVMGGDLQAAIDLIFSGWLGEDDSAN